MANTFLTHGIGGEVAELTGAKQRPKQIGALARMGVHFFVAPDGWPRVARSEIERRDGLPARADEPDFSSLAR